MRGKGFVALLCDKFTEGSVAFLDDLLVVEVDCQPALSRQLKHFFGPWIAKRSQGTHSRVDFSIYVATTFSLLRVREVVPPPPLQTLLGPEAIVLLEQIDEQRLALP